MPVRKVIRIDEEKCDGCGQCATACAEGAIQIIQGKARLVSETYCDGLGACLGECPQGAITLEERQAGDFDPVAVTAHLAALAGSDKPQTVPHRPQPRAQSAGCPGSTSQAIERDSRARGKGDRAQGAEVIPQLSNWPVQLHLTPVCAPSFDGADLLIAADCAPFAFAEFHQQFIAGKKLLIGCPKLDDTSIYADKLRQIFSLNNIRSIEIAIMEVPCCFGLFRLVQQALAECGKDIPLLIAKLGIRGEILQRTPLPADLPVIR
jgi:ferredoxin